MELTKDRLYVFRVEGMDYNDKEHRIDYKLSKEVVFFDKGRAVYYHGFTNQFILIGFLRMIFSDLATEVMQTAHKLGDTFIIGNQGMAIIWTGTWEPLERSGFIGTTFHRGMLDAMIREIYESIDKNGKLKDRC